MTRPDKKARPTTSTVTAARDSARAAIVDCAPYELLPPERYEDWRRIDMTFQFRAPRG